MPPLLVKVLVLASVRGGIADQEILGLSQSGTQELPTANLKHEQQVQPQKHLHTISK